jgi:uncharacterized Zn finger protein
MSRYYDDWAPYVPVAERRRRAERAVARLRKTGRPVAPVAIAGRHIATTFWGRAWCNSMESYRDYESRLPRGRTYVRNGSVVDLQIAPGRITALVSGLELYDVAITVKETVKAQWRSICADCAASIDSLVELLQGRFSKGVMERLCRQEGGLFPRPADIRFSCSCQDHASMCKHVAAALYGVGARFDHRPELLFRLRMVDEADLVARVNAASQLSKTAPAASKVLETDDISALFGLDMGAPIAATASATAVVAEAKVRSRESVGMPPEEPALKKQARTVPKAPGKPSVPRRTTDAKAASGSTVIEKTNAVTETGTTRRKPAATPEPAATHRRRKVGSAGAPGFPEVPGQGRGERPTSKDKAMPARASKQKPVKWW